MPYTDDMIQNAAYGAIGQAQPDTDAASEVAARYGDATHLRAFDGDPEQIAEMDALVAYLQILRSADRPAAEDTANGGVLT